MSDRSDRYMIIRTYIHFLGLWYNNLQRITILLLSFYLKHSILFETSDEDCEVGRQNKNPHVKVQSF